MCKQHKHTQCTSRASKRQRLILYEFNENSHTLNIDLVRIFPYEMSECVCECIVRENTRERCTWRRKEGSMRSLNQKFIFKV